MRTMTLQFTDLLFDEMPFDEKGSNKWEESSIRRNINSTAFKEKFEEGFRRLLVPVLKENGDREATLDTFFLLSVEEMKAEEKKYQRFRSERDCVKVNPEHETEWHWTRSANRDISCNAWYVFSSGYVGNTSAINAFRCAPACVIGAKAIK